MDIQQLKLLAGHVRNLLTQADRSVSHNQSLDLIAAVPGLRNWPEVQAFPDRVAGCELDDVAARRLAYRLQHKFELSLTSQEILAALTPRAPFETALQIWPTGPSAGVYVTTSRAAIDAAVARYEEATDGAVLYAERAASNADGAIDLGEYGLWSPGLDRVPSGTLIVVGPLELVQGEWERSTQRLQMACTVADVSGHRVAVLVETPAPDDICEDVRVMATTAVPEGVEYEPALRGVVTESGELIQRVPFARSWPPIQSVHGAATSECIPDAARRLLSEALKGRRSGLLVFGGDSVMGHWAPDLVEAGLALTEHAGPAARIMPRTRSTPAKNWLVPEATKQLPFLPSIQSAYQRGYRRMVVDPHNVEGDVLKELAGEVLFIGGTHGYEASNILFSAVRAFGAAEDHMDVLTQVVGLLGVARFPSQTGVFSICDLFIGPRIFPASAERMKDIAKHVDENRAMKWEIEVQRLIDSGEMRLSDLKKTDLKSSMLARFAEQISQRFARPND